MAIYKNDFTKEEDETLWEIHEIRHKLHEENRKKSNDQINAEAKRILDEHRKKRIRTAMR